VAIRWGKSIDDLTRVQAAADQGFDFVQPVSALAAELEDVEKGASRLPLAVCAVPLSAEVRVTQRGFNLYAWMDHLREAARSLAALGCRRLHWSDGRARVLPVEGERGDLKEQVLLFLAMLCDLAARHEITVLVEPLGPRRTNFLNTLGEVAEFLRRAGKENLSSMISLRELEPIGLGVDGIGVHHDLIRYVQLENPRIEHGARVCPRPSDGHDYGPFLRALKDVGYDGEIGLPADADAEGLAFCRDLWDRA
jgi:sugar phosphate isomerase/epimerase